MTNIERFELLRERSGASSCCEIGREGEILILFLWASEEQDSLRALLIGFESYSIVSLFISS